MLFWQFLAMFLVQINFDFCGLTTIATVDRLCVNLTAS